MNTLKSQFRRTFLGAFAAVSALVGLSAHAQTVTPVNGLTYFATVDGVGSLVDPRNGGACTAIGLYGCSRDELILQGNGFSPSAGLFQVLRDTATCNSVTITGVPAQAGGSYILVKSWNERFPTDKEHNFSRAYETVSGTVVVPLATATDWSTIAVVSKGSLPAGTRQSVRATCNSGNFNSGISTVRDAAGGLGKIFLNDVTSFSYWTGNGSLITPSFNTATNDTALGYGRTIDVVQEFGDGNYSTQFFQVYKSGGTCANVIVSSSTPGVAAKIRSKAWDAPNWNERSSGFIQLPLNVSVGNASSGYYLLSVEPASNATRSSITMQCN